MATLDTYPTITDDEFVGKLKVWTESTTTSPSGLHLEHFKALIASHKFSSEPPDDETAEESAKREELNQMQRDLRGLHLSLINYALERGNSFQRWKTVANTIYSKTQAAFGFTAHESFISMKPIIISFSVSSGVLHCTNPRLCIN